MIEPRYLRLSERSPASRKLWVWLALLLLAGYALSADDDVPVIAQASLGDASINVFTLLPDRPYLLSSDTHFSIGFKVEQPDIRLSFGVAVENTSNDNKPALLLRELITLDSSDPKRQRVELKIPAPMGGLIPGTIDVVVRYGAQRQRILSIPVRPPGNGDIKESSPTKTDSDFSPQPQSVAQDATDMNVAQTVEPDAPRELEAQVTVGDLTAVFTRAVDAQHDPLEPTAQFSESDDVIYLAFHSQASEKIRATVNVYAENVENVKPDYPLWRNVWVRLPPGVKHSLEFKAPKQGFFPGTYRFEIEVGQEKSRVGIEVIPLHPMALLDEEVDRAFGYNLALAALGGQIVSATSQRDDKRWAKRNLNDGAIYRLNKTGSRCETCGWAAARPITWPQDIVIDFAGDDPARIGAVVINTETGEWRSDQFPKYVEIWTKTDDGETEFSQVASARLRPEAKRQWILLPQDNATAALKVRIVSNFGADYTILGEIEVLEADSEKTSILEDIPINLVRPELGGALVRYTSSKQDPHLVERLIDSAFDKPVWHAHDDYVPQDFTFAFKDDAEALVDRLRLVVPADEKPATWPTKISIEISDHPLDHFESLGIFDVEPGLIDQEFPISRRARFVKLRLLENGGGRHTSLAEVEILEGKAPGYVPLLLRKTLGPNALSARSAEVRTVDLVADTDESEPNDELAQANRLEFGVSTKGSIDPLGEDDHFELEVPPRDAATITLDVSGSPNIRTSIAVLDTEGKSLNHFDPGAHPVEHTTFSWLLQGTEQFVRVTEPEVSTILVWDTSGSMKGQTEDLERAVKAYIENIPNSQRLNLIRFSNEVEVLLDDFTKDKSKISAAIEGKFGAVGGTRFYDAVAKAVELLEGVSGNRAVIVMTDGADTGSRLGHPGFWRLIQESRIRLYIIGLGAGLRHPVLHAGSTGERVLRHAALATNGRLLFAEDSDQLDAFYATIANELHVPAAYVIKPTLSQGTGRFDVVSTGDRIERVSAPQVQLILDASGSMREKKKRIDGQLKIEVAKNVLRKVISSLPEGSQVALRVYGRRIREGRRGDCQDTELLQPLAPLDKKRLLKHVDEIKALGTTPLAYSLQQAAADFEGRPGDKIIILITDGKEECGGDPRTTVQKIVAAGLDVRVNVVGFALAEESVKRDMAGVASMTGGRFFDASDEAELITALDQAMAAPYKLLDAANNVVATGVMSTAPISAPEGIYRLSVAAVGKPITLDHVVIKAKNWTRVELRKEGQEVGKHILGPVATAEVPWSAAVEMSQTPDSGKPER